jgi:hypothetical protein
LPVRSKRALPIAVALLAMLAATAVFGTRLAMSRARERELRQGEIADFKALPAAAPYRFLMCPPDFCNVRPDATSPVFALPWEDLRDRWSELVAREKGLRLVAGDGDLGRLTYILQSPILRLPDLVTVQFVALGENTATFAVVSQPRYAWPDLGTNRARVEAWVRALEKAGGVRSR